jgi:uncharacterized Zn finger protein
VGAVISVTQRGKKMFQAEVEGTQAKIYHVNNISLNYVGSTFGRCTYPYHLEG